MSNPDAEPEPTDPVALAERTAHYEAGQRADRTLTVRFVEPWSLSKYGPQDPKVPKFTPQPRRWS